MDGLTADLWSKLTAPERVEHCRLAAQEAQRYAETASPATRPRYQQLADEWLALAAEIAGERELSY